MVRHLSNELYAFLHFGQSLRTKRCATTPIRDEVTRYGSRPISTSLVAQVAALRMMQAGVVPITWVAVAAELQKDWRNDTGQELAEIMSTHLPFYGNVIASFTAVRPG